MPDVLLGESRVYITDSLRKELGWSRGERITVTDGSRKELVGGAVPTQSEAPTIDGRAPARGIFYAFGMGQMHALRRLCQRGGEWYFDIKIPGVRRGRLNGSRTCKHSVENGTLVLDVRELLRAADG